MKEKFKNIVVEGDSVRPQKKNTQKGITLIALIISIIIMLILAVVSINIIQNQEIITKTKTAVDKYNDEAEKELIQLGYTKYMTDKYMKKIPLKLDVEGAKVTGNEESGWTITFANGNVYTLSKDGEIEGPTNNGGGTEEGTTVGWTDNGDGTITKGATTLSIGDYVAYNEAGTGNYTTDTTKGIGGSVGGVDSTTGKSLLNSKTYTTEDLGWRVLGVNEKGELELISDNPMSEDQNVCLANEEGYLYGADEMNRMCNTLYGNGTNSVGKVVATEARSLNIDDINKLANYDPKTYGGYGDIFTYRFPTEGNYMQYKSTKENGTLVTDWTYITNSSCQTFRMPGDTNTISSSNRDNNGKSLKYTFYDYSISEKITDTSIADMITKGVGTSYINQWLASSYVICYPNYANFGMRNVGIGGGFSGSLFYSYGSSSDRRYRVRPVVSLKSDIQIEKTESNDGSILEKACIIKY